MENNTDIVELLECIEDTLDEGGIVPLTGRVMVHKEKLFDIITEIKMKLPNSLNQAKWVLEERNKILNDAQKESNNMVKEAEMHANKLISENEVIKKANIKAKRMLDEAERISKEMKVGALEYSDNVLYNLEKSLKSSMDEFHQQFMKIEESYQSVLQTVNQNRRELRGMANNQQSNEDEQ